MLISVRSRAYCGLLPMSCHRVASVLFSTVTVVSLSRTSVSQLGNMLIPPKPQISQQESFQTTLVRKNEKKTNTLTRKSRGKSKKQVGDEHSHLVTLFIHIDCVRHDTFFIDGGRYCQDKLIVYSVGQSI